MLTIWLASLGFHFPICKIKRISFSTFLRLKQEKVKVVRMFPSIQSVIVLIKNNKKLKTTNKTKQLRYSSTSLRNTNSLDFLLISDFTERKHRVSQDVFSFARWPHQQGQAVCPADSGGGYAPETDHLQACVLLGWPSALADLSH